MITVTHFSTFQKFQKISKILKISKISKFLKSSTILNLQKSQKQLEIEQNAANF